MSRVLILCPDHIKRRMSGPAIRYFELAHQLHRAGHEVTLGTRGQPDLAPQPFEILTIEESRLRRLAPRQDVIVVQGNLLDVYPFLRTGNAGLVVDLYCPFYLELLVDRQYNPTPEQLSHPIEPLRVTLDQIRLGDFFICASEKQRDYWLGLLTAVNRVNAATYDADPSLRSLIDVVPFGLPDEPPLKRGPSMRNVFPGISASDYLLLWGSSIYNWFDPLTLIRAIGKVRHRLPELRMVVMATAHANPDLIPEPWMLGEARKLSAELGLTGKHVFFNEGWVPYEERADWLLEADVGVSANFAHIEGHFSFRVRFLDYLWAGLPFLCTAGDVLAQAVESEHLGITIPAGDVDGMAAALERLADPGVRETYRKNVQVYRAGLSWSRAAAPLVRFCDKPGRAPDLAEISPLRAMPVPLRDYAAANANGSQGWRYYAVKAVSTLVYNGPFATASKGSKFVGRTLIRRRRPPG